VLTQAVKENASDIHVEPFENRLVVRFRVDGVLREVLTSKRAVAPLVVSRIKVMSKLDIAEKRLPQDGRISLRIAGPSVDVRVSTLPSGHGERVVMRILDKQAGRLKLSALGMDPKTESLIATCSASRTASSWSPAPRARARPPRCTRPRAPERQHAEHHDGRGSDRVLHRRHRPDPGQHQGGHDLRARPARHPAPGPGRGDGRRNPRPGTAQIAVQASLTGHLVLSTLHTNTAVGAVTRLRDMGIEPFLLSSSLIGVIAQRLVRTLNPDNKQAFEAGEYERRLLGLGPNEPSPTLYKPANFNGFRGRTGIYELVIVDDQMRTMIHDEAAEHELEKYARTMTPSIRDDGLDKVLRGETTLEEVLRVTRED
jgi:general secretion pathway protein E